MQIDHHQYSFHRHTLAWVAVPLLLMASSLVHGQTDPDPVLASKTAFVDPPAVSFPTSPLVDVYERQVPTIDGQQWRVIAFLGCECPVARLYAKRLQELAAEYGPKGVQWIGVMSNLHDSAEDIQKFSTTLGLEFPFVKDADQQLARSVRATRTAEVLVVDAKGTIVYRGRIDDQYAPGIKRSQRSREELKDALDAVLSGKSPNIHTTEPVGCLISWDKEPEATTATYSNTVANILYQHCYECHRAGEIGPFDISDIKEIKGWASMILEVIDDGRMPPWHADPAHGSFKNARSMSKEEIETIREWVRAGSPLGDIDAIPKPPQLVSGWRMEHEPDLVVSMPSSTPYRIPATGSVDYQYFVVDPHLTEDRWVSSAQVIPGNAAVVHHAIVFIRPPDGTAFSGIGWLTAYVPGQVATRFPKGYARLLPAGSKLVFQMHYTPNGEETTDLSKIGLCFIDESEVTKEVFTLIAIDQDFEIPPNAPNHQVVTSVPELPAGSELLAVSPHMHWRGKSFELRSVRNDVSNVLLRVPRYDFNWQHTYEFASALDLNDIDQLEVTASFDNSADNPFNPAPDEYVMWGDQTWEEMAVAFFEVAKTRSEETSTRSGNRDSRLASSQSTMVTGDEQAAAEKFADHFLKQQDRDRDGCVVWDEATSLVKERSFYSFDQDADRKITREELISTFLSRRPR